MSRAFIAHEFNYYKSQCKQEREYLSQARKENNWRMVGLAQNNLASAQRQFFYYRRLLAQNNLLRA